MRFTEPISEHNIARGLVINHNYLRIIAFAALNAFMYGKAALAQLPGDFDNSR
jgi:hypothetical protein